jgi:hypothetical protein
MSKFNIDDRVVITQRTIFSGIDTLNNLENYFKVKIRDTIGTIQDILPLHLYTVHVSQINDLLVFNEQDLNITPQEEIFIIPMEDFII